MTLYAELVDASDGSSVWSDRFTRTRTDILAIEEYFAGEIATALGLEITPDQEARFERRYTDSAEAHAAYLRGRFHWNRRTEDEVRQGLAYFQEALEHDPTYALAYAGLADTYNILGDYGYLAPGAAFPEAKAAATRPSPSTRRSPKRTRRLGRPRTCTTGTGQHRNRASSGASI